VLHFNCGLFSCLATKYPGSPPLKEFLTKCLFFGKKEKNYVLFHPTIRCEKPYKKFEMACNSTFSALVISGNRHRMESKIEKQPS
jgi:hypothetical protein